MHTLKRSVKGGKGVNPMLPITPNEIFGKYWLSLRRVYPLYVPPLWVERGETVPVVPLDKLQAYLGVIDGLLESELPNPVRHSLRQAKALISKIPGPKKAAQAAAEETWLECEAKCKASNERISRWSSPASTPFHSVMDRARALILNIIGELTPTKYARIIARARDSSGVSLGTTDRTRTAPVYKSLRDYTRATVTPSAVPMAVDFYRNSPLRIGRELALVPHGDVSCYSINLTPSNRVAFVPKSLKTFRSIAIEPLINLRIQLGVHDMWVDLFSKKSIAFLRDQRINQLFAKLGSLASGLDSLATLDLSNASDTISRELVRWLLPESWFLFLDDLRVKTSIFRGEEVELEKFSSMGNGFTFALETLIFWSLSEACRLECNAPYLTVAYGDDIICPTQCALLVTDVLSECGLSVNADKSFLVGGFRESCGADWQDGELVTPVYLRKRVVRCDDAHRLLNHFGVIKKSKLLRSYLLQRYAETRKVIFGLPNEDPGSCVFTTLEYLKGIGQARWHSDFQTWRFQGLTHLGLSNVEDENVAYLSALISGARATPRRGAVKTRLRWMTAGKPATAQL